MLGREANLLVSHFTADGSLTRGLHAFISVNTSAGGYEKCVTDASRKRLIGA
ncbi:MAG: hypothetical protein WB650_14010 [Candidatus Binatus sp.]